MADRTFGWWRIKRGFRGDAEFLLLAQIASSRSAYMEALGLWLTVLDSAHTQDAQRPKRALVASDASALALLVEAGVLEADGGIPDEAWAKYRVRDQQTAAGTARAAGAARSPEGRFVASVAPAGTGPASASVDQPNTETETETKNETIVTKRENDLSSRRRLSRGVERLSDTPAFRNLGRSVDPTR